MTAEEVRKIFTDNKGVINLHKFAENNGMTYGEIRAFVFMGSADEKKLSLIISGLKKISVNV